ncbi:SGNH/GDSL hydrolase family protein [Parabacteroides sp. AM08-6]|uniref:SGNH/GDSL hydrolase family protein n=1 Tax=Parabacteroides sp. AM08-6 TaxID=2292053 RepID=UPI000EFE2265|nr:SGNH/GDSL hydrolase family protein [Parabacteroides sp. AM08-6]RHJ83561.1 acylhydrolase [Parabacteroides sp. AM08-6]
MKNIKQILMIVACTLATSTLFAQNDWAGFNRYDADNKALQTAPKVVFMGNSITEGWWNNDPDFFKVNNYLGRGISGQTSSQMLVRFRTDVINLKPKAVVILAGTNDIAQNTGYIALENILGNIISMAELAKAHKIKVYLCSVLPAYDFGWRKGLEPAPKIVKLNKMIKDYADKNKMTYVDYYSKLVDDRGGLPEKYSQDGVHPTLEGYKVMENIISNALKSVK